MAQSVKLSEKIMAFVRRESALQSRSVAGQITHWINIGRAVENSGAFDHQRINDVLQANLSPDDLTADEQDVWFSQFAANMTRPGKVESEFYAKRQKLGCGVGLSDTGQLVYQGAAPTKQTSSR